MPLANIAAQMQCSLRTVEHIARGTTWRHLGHVPLRSPTRSEGMRRYWAKARAKP
jgi:hypothetical protein